MRPVKITLLSALLIAIGGALGGCEQGPTRLASPLPATPLDKRPCPAVVVTYRDPATIDEPWSGGIKDFCVVEAKSVYHLLHITDPGTGWHTREGELTFGHATSADLLVWDTQARIDLRTDGAGWSPSFTWAPHVVFNEDDGLYYMFYTGVKWAEGAPLSSAEQRVGLARSADLFAWKRYDEHGEDGLVLDGPDHEQHPWSAYGTAGVDLPWEYDCRDPFVFDRGPEHGAARWVMLNSVRLAPDAALMAIAFATSGDLVTWQWQYYLDVTVGAKAESASLLERDGAFYLFWTDRDDAPGVRVACSMGGVFGAYTAINADDLLFGLANELLADSGLTRYLAFDDAYVLHVKRDLMLPAVPTPMARVRIAEFTRCDPDGPIQGRDH